MMHLSIYLWELLRTNLSFYIIIFLVCLFVKYSSNDWERKKTKIRNGKTCRIGLEENISLPSTGEKAMHRLLACKGKDPYSILGLRADASDEDIKKYHRKQAVLVHPDKNEHTDAEEAFKILHNAFELVGDPVQRKTYDTQVYMQELEEKVEMASNSLGCRNCGGEHGRISVDRQSESARYCCKCDDYHSVKEGDMWAETTVLGFCWRYYACMDGNKVYDITEWIECQKMFFERMQANSHQIFYRFETGKSKRHCQKQSRSTSKCRQEQSKHQQSQQSDFHQNRRSKKNNKKKKKA